MEDMSDSVDNYGGSGGMGVVAETAVAVGVAAGGQDSGETVG